MAGTLPLCETRCATPGWRNVVEGSTERVLLFSWPTVTGERALAGRHP